MTAESAMHQDGPKHEAGTDQLLLAESASGAFHLALY